MRAVLGLFPGLCISSLLVWWPGLSAGTTGSPLPRRSDWYATSGAFHHHILRSLLLPPLSQSDPTPLECWQEPNQATRYSEMAFARLCRRESRAGPSDLSIRSERGSHVILTCKRIASPSLLPFEVELDYLPGIHQLDRYVVSVDLSSGGI